MKRILTVVALLAVAGCGGGDDLEWLDAAVDGTTRGEASADAATAIDADGPAIGAESERRVVFVDVRRPDEWAAGHVTGAIHIPHTEMSERLSELAEYRDAEIVLYCRTGNRSGIAKQILEQAGFEHLHNGGALTDLERRGVPTTR